MLFRKIPRSCSYCKHSTKICDGSVLCIKHGIRSADGACSKFSYDPLKRIPVKAKAIDTDKYDDKDYSL